MQLDALLRSLKENSGELFDRISVLYLCSGNSQQRSYQQLRKEHPTIHFFKESWLRGFRKTLIRNCIVPDFVFTCFMVDDMIFFEKTNELREKIFKHFDNDIACLTLRLGINSKYSHPANKHYSLKNHIVINERMIKWRWQDQEEGDLNYPLSLDGHIFRTADILPLMKKIPFINPNSLEAGLQKFLKEIPPFIMSFTRSILVGIPANLVNSTTVNFHGKTFPFHQDELCKLYNEGKRIDINKMDFDNIIGPHQEIKFEFTP